jgi:hypothetical protein
MIVYNLKPEKLEILQNNNVSIEISTLRQVFSK